MDFLCWVELFYPFLDWCDRVMLLLMMTMMILYKRHKYAFDIIYYIIFSHGLNLGLMICFYSLGTSGLDPNLTYCIPNFGHASYLVCWSCFRNSGNKYVFQSYLFKTLLSLNFWIFEHTHFAVFFFSKGNLLKIRCTLLSVEPFILIRQCCLAWLWHSLMFEFSCLLRE